MSNIVVLDGAAFMFGHLVSRHVVVDERVGARGGFGTAELAVC